MILSRRKFLIFTAALPVLAACSDDDPSSVATATTDSTDSTDTTSTSPTAAATATTLAPTPSCADDDDETPAQTEGPYFSSGSPQKPNLYGDVNTGTKLTVSGAVLTTACKAVNAAKIEVWQADATGEYDNSGYRLRGHLFTDAQGRYQFVTQVPGIYTGRARHIHIKVQPPNGSVLTTQLYFPGDAAANAQDGIYDKALLLGDYKATGSAHTAAFNFVV